MSDCKIAVITPGYVGLPFAVELGKQRQVVGFDIDVIRDLQSFGAMVDVHNPWADPVEARHEYGLELVKEPAPGANDGIIVAVPHQCFKEMGADANQAPRRDGALSCDLKAIFAAEHSEIRR